MPTRPSRFRYAESIEHWITLALIATLIIGCYLVLAPFISAILWAIVLCCTTWPLFEHLVRANHGRKSAAALLLTFAIALVLLAPFLIVGMTLADNAGQLADITQRVYEESLQR